MSVFDVINNLTASKEYIYTPELEPDIVPYMINTSMSQYYDCIMYANEANIRPELSKRMVYDYYHFAIQPKKKRYAKWGSPKKELDVVMIAEFYNCNFKHAAQYLSILTPEQVEIIRKKTDTGGRK